VTGVGSRPQKSYEAVGAPPQPATRSRIEPPTPDATHRPPTTRAPVARIVIVSAEIDLSFLFRQFVPNDPTQRPV
jgi:hypothetical protein